MILFSSASFALNGGRTSEPFQPGELTNSLTSEYVFSAKGTTHTAFTKPIRHLLTGISRVDVHFRGSDHKVLWHKVIVGSCFYGSTVHTDAAVVLKDNTGSWGKDWDDPFEAAVDVSLLGESMTADELEQASYGLTVDSIEVRQVDTSGAGPYYGHGFHVLNPVWPLKANQSTELLLKLQVRPEFDPNRLELLSLPSAYQCRANFYSDKQNGRFIAQVARIQPNGKGECTILIPFDLCQGTLWFNVALYKLLESTQPNLIHSYYAGGLLSFV